MKKEITKVPDQNFRSNYFFSFLCRFRIFELFPKIQGVEGTQLKLKMKIELIETGFFYADGGAMFGAIPKTAWSKRYPADAANGCVLAMRSLLVRTPEGRIILIDTGAGDKQLRELAYYRFFGLTDLGVELRKRGVEPEEVTDVVLTHLHFDHCGYVTLKDEATGCLRAAFPHAVHWVSNAQWQRFLHPHPLEAASFMPENMELIANDNRLRLIAEDTSLCPGVLLKCFNGHTEGQIAPYIDGEERTYVFAGDVIPLAASVSPHWISAYDTNPLESYDAKWHMLEEAVSQKQALFFCHDAYTPCATVKKITDFFKADEVFNQSVFS